MKKSKWYEVLAIILLCVIFSPFIIFVLIVWFFQNVLPAPFEYKKYKKSKYYEFYKKKYKIGITHDEQYLLQNKLLEDDIYLEEIRKQYGYMCLLNNDFCFALFDITDLKLIDGDFQIKLHENSPYISIDDFIEDEKKCFYEECKNRKFVIFIWREDEKEYFDILSNRQNKLSLQSKGVIFYIDTEDLVETVKEYIANKE
jgi:hypothetical protein